MHLMAVGLSHKTASVDLRERVSIADVHLDDALSRLRNCRTVLESVVLSTCNRTEVYAIVSSLRAGDETLRRFLQQVSEVPADILSKALYTHHGQAAARHLMRVASGLDSLVLGETQILGQVKSGFLAAQDVGNTGALLNQLFRSAISLGKRAQTETAIGQSAVSVSYAAVQLAKKILGNLTGARVLLVGAGKMSQLTARYLRDAGASDLMIVNRTFESALELADLYGGRAVPWENLDGVLGTADIVISSTRSPEPVLRQSQVQAALRRKSGRPLVLVDIAVPRDIDPLVGQLRNVYLYDIDDLEGVVAANVADREAQADFVEGMIETSLKEYSDWLSEQEVVPLITALREKGMQIQASVMQSLTNKLPTLSDRERELLQKHTMSIVNQLLKDPIQNMKELAIASGHSEHVRVFAELFGISEAMLQKQPGGLWNTGVPSADTADSFADIVRHWRERLFHDANSDAEKWHPVLR